MPTPKVTHSILFSSVYLITRASFASMRAQKWTRKKWSAPHSRTGCFFSHFSCHPPRRERSREWGFFGGRPASVNTFERHLFAFGGKNPKASSSLWYTTTHQYDIQIRMTIENVSARVYFILSDDDVMCGVYFIHFWCTTPRHRLLFLFKINTHPFNFISRAGAETPRWKFKKVKYWGGGAPPGCDYSRTWQYIYSWCSSHLIRYVWRAILILHLPRSGLVSGGIPPILILCNV